MGESWAGNRNAALCAVIPMVMTGVITPTIYAMASRMSSEDVQGEVQGSLMGVQLLCEGTGPLLFAQLIHLLWVSGDSPGHAYAFGVSVVLIELLAVWRLPKNHLIATNIQT